MQTISTPEGDVSVTMCTKGNDLLILPERPVKKSYLLYGGLQIGIPYLGFGLTYVEQKNGKQDIHLNANLEGSLGSNGVSIQYGKHPFKNLFFYGATARAYLGVPGEKGVEMGPTVGLMGGEKLITGFLTLSVLGGYNTRMDSLTLNPELSVGLRVRLFKATP